MKDDVTPPVAITLQTGHWYRGTLNAVNTGVIAEQGVYSFRVDVSWILDDLGTDGLQSPILVAGRNGTIASQEFFGAPRLLYECTAEANAGCNALDNYSVSVLELSAAAGKQTLVYNIKEKGVDQEEESSSDGGPSWTKRKAFTREGYGVLENGGHFTALLLDNSTGVRKLEEEERDFPTGQLATRKGTTITIGQSFLRKGVSGSSAYLFLQGVNKPIELSGSSLSLPKTFTGNGREIGWRAGIVMREKNVKLTLDESTTSENAGKSRDGIVAAFKRSLKMQGVQILP